MIGYLINGLLTSLAIFCNEEEDGNSNTIFYNGKMYYEVVYDIYSNISEQIPFSETQKMTLYFERTQSLDYGGNDKTSWNQKCMNILNSYYVIICFIIFFLLLNLFLSNLKEQGKNLTLLLSISVFSSITFYFSYFLENNDSILTSSLYFFISIYFFYYGLDFLLDLLLQSIESNNQIKPNQNLGFSHIKGKIILLTLFTILCYIISCSHSSDLYVIPFIISFLSLIYYVSKSVNPEKLHIIQPLSDLIYIILGLLWIFQNWGIKRAKRRNLIFEEAGIIMIEYNLYSFMICKYYSLEKFLANDNSVRKEQTKLLLNQLNQPITLKDGFILLILLANIIIYVIGLFSHNLISILAAQYGLLRVYVFLISSKGRVTHTLGEILIILLMLLFCHSFNILRELVLRDVLLKRSLVVYFYLCRIFAMF